MREAVRAPTAVNTLTWVVLPFYEEKLVTVRFDPLFLDPFDFVDLCDFFFFVGHAGDEPPGRSLCTG